MRYRDVQHARASPLPKATDRPIRQYLHERRDVLELVDVLEEVLDVVGDVLHVRVHRLELPLVHLHHDCNRAAFMGTSKGMESSELGYLPWCWW